MMAILGAATAIATAPPMDWDARAAIIAALVAAFAAIWVYYRQQSASRRDGRATIYAEALRAVEDYLEGPYRIRRRDGSAQARLDVTSRLSDVKSAMSFYCAWLEVNAPKDVVEKYRQYVEAAQREAGAQMTAAWAAPTTTRDCDVPLGKLFDRQASDAARAAVIHAMRADLNP